MKKHAFIITSALNTKFGVFNTEQRLQQTVATIDSILERVPDAVIFLMEVAGEPLTDEQKAVFNDRVDFLFDFTDNDKVKKIYQNPSWDVVKSSTEMMCFAAALKQLKDNNLLEGIDRVFKISGRYQLNDNFKIDYYEQVGLSDRIAIKHRQKSQFDLAVTQVAEQYMSRLWSFPAHQIDEIIKTYYEMLKFMGERVAAGGYVDIEHCLFKFLDPNKILELDTVGVQGNLGPNARFIND